MAKAKMDWMDLEKERGITITAAATFCEWRGCRSTSSTRRTRRLHGRGGTFLRVLDGAIGFSPPWKAWSPERDCLETGQPLQRAPRCVCQQDGQGRARFEEVVREMHEKLGANAVPIQLPIGNEADFSGLVEPCAHAGFDLGRGRPGGGVPRRGDPAGAFGVGRGRRGRCCWKSFRRRTMRSWPLTSTAKTSPRTPSEGAQIRHGAEQSCFPLCAGRHSRTRASSPSLTPWSTTFPRRRHRADHGNGAQHGDYIQRAPREDEPFAALAFKIMTDPFVGNLPFSAYIRETLMAGRTSIIRPPTVGSG